MKFLISLFLFAIVLNANNLELGMKAAQNNNLKQAYEYFTLASQEGNRIAQQNLAVLLYNGYGVAKDQEAAISLFKSPSELVVSR